MKITILSYEKEMVQTERMMIAAAQESGHEISVMRNHFFQLDFTGKKSNLLYKNKEFPKTDVVIVRPEFNDNYESYAGTIKQIENMGIPVVNGYIPTIITKNKIRTLQYLQKNGLSFPKTVIVNSRENLEEAVDKFTRYPIILKKPVGREGVGVMFMSEKKTLSSVMDVLLHEDKWGGQYMLQEYVKEAKNKDLRIFIVGNKIIAAMERIAKPGEFRANFSLGGEVKLAQLTDAEKKLALTASKVIGIEISGVDIIRSKSGPMILEVNSNPGFIGITKATGVDVAKYIIDYAVKKAEKEKQLQTSVKMGVKKVIRKLFTGVRPKK